MEDKVTPNIIQIEKAIQELSFEEKLWLMEQILHQLKGKAHVSVPQFNDQYMQEQIKAMANDPYIQAEMKAINEEFSVAESDGLHGL